MTEAERKAFVARIVQRVVRRAFTFQEGGESTERAFVKALEYELEQLAGETSLTDEMRRRALNGDDRP